MARSGTGRGTTWTVKWDGFSKRAVHVGKDLSMSRPDPSQPPSGRPAEPRKAESAPSKPKPVASKAPDVVDATFSDSDDDDDSSGGDDEEEDGGGHELIQPKTHAR